MCKQYCLDVCHTQPPGPELSELVSKGLKVLRIKMQRELKNSMHVLQPSLDKGLKIHILYAP